MINAPLHRGYRHSEAGDHESRPDAADYPPGATIAHDDFVTGGIDRQLTGELYASDALQETFEILRSLPLEERRRANRALAWMAEGTRIGEGTLGGSPSIKIACYVAAIEAILPDQVPVKCETCGQETYQITSRVNEFLDEFADSSMRQEYRKQVYDSQWSCSRRPPLRRGFTNVPTVFAGCSDR